MPELTNIQLSSIHYVVLAVATTLLLAQALVKQKQSMHILFAVFCGSIAMATAQKITGDSVGAYQYLIGMGACATCNGYWLLARTMFREKNPFSLHHVMLAVLVGLLVMIKQGYLFVDSFWQFSPDFDHIFAGVLREITIMLSSLVLLMGIWEGCRGFFQASKTQKAQRITFLATFVSAIAISKFIRVSHADSPETINVLIAGITLFVICMTQILVFWITTTRQTVQNQIAVNSAGETEIAEQVKLPTDNSAADEELKFIELDQQLSRQMEELIIEQQLFLQANLKVADIARALDVSEYRISRVLKHHFCAKNFNQFINELRIKHAQKLLADPDNKKWPVLVVGLESGFASVGPFTRAFKHFTGVTPNQFREDVCNIPDGV